MNETYEIPGAEAFSRYLAAQVGTELQVSGPEVLDLSYGMDFTRRYIVRAGDQVLGEFYQFGPKPGEKQMGKEFRGRVPGYVNEAIVIHNQYRGQDEETMPVDTVSLSW